MSQHYSEVAKLELVCTDKHADKVVNTIQKNAYAGMKGDGIIYISLVEKSVKIRTGES